MTLIKIKIYLAWECPTSPYLAKLQRLHLLSSLSRSQLATWLYQMTSGTRTRPIVPANRLFEINRFRKTEHCKTKVSCLKVALLSSYAYQSSIRRLWIIWLRFIDVKLSLCARRDRYNNSLNRKNRSNFLKYYGFDKKREKNNNKLKMIEISKLN